MIEQLGLALDPRGNIATTNYMSSVDGIFAAGDMRRGQSLVVWAIAEGRKAAAAVNEYLAPKDEPLARFRHSAAVSSRYINSAASLHHAAHTLSDKHRSWCSSASTRTDARSAPSSAYPRPSCSSADNSWLALVCAAGSALKPAIKFSTAAAVNAGS